jgi:hypothetical protein
MSKRIVFGVHVSNRVKEVPGVQKILTDYGCNVKTRLGLHEVSDSACSAKGLLLLEMHGDESKSFELRDKLNAVEGVTVKEMVFEE